MFMGSADLMPRNLYNRVELVTPVEDPRIRGEMLDVLERCLADNTNAWVLGQDGSWRRRRPNGEPRNVQREMMELHEDASVTSRALVGSTALRACARSRRPSLTPRTPAGE